MPMLRFKRSLVFFNSQLKSVNFFVKRQKSYMGTKSISSENKSSQPVEHHSLAAADEAAVSLQEWQAWGTISPVPRMVVQVIRDLKLLERETDSHMTFDGNHGSLSGDFKVQEDKKHRAKYASLGDSEEKLQFFSARQIACRLLGSRGYLCQKCWLASEDCMCLRVTTCPLSNRLHFWLYMHPKDFLRQNNTGKLLWQVFGVQAATLCLFGITEHEEMMWNVFKLEGFTSAFVLVNIGSAMELIARFSCLLPEHFNLVPFQEVLDFHVMEFMTKHELEKCILHTEKDCLPSVNASFFLDVLIVCGRNKVWCLYPNKNATTLPVTDIVCLPRDLERQENRDDTMHFILIDGTWNNSNAMFRRLQDRAKLIWGNGLHCVSLNTGVSLMHKLRPQPSWDRTCTAAAAIGLFYELRHVQEFSSFGWDKQAEAIENSLEVLLEALTARRLRMGRSISRRGRHNDDIC